MKREELLKLRAFVSEQKQIIIVTSLFFLLYLFLSWKLNVWEDEVYTLSTISKSSFADMVRSSIVFEGQPPFYFILAFFWAKINDSVFFMRLLSTIFTIISGLLIYAIYKKKNPYPPWWVIILVFANPFMLYLATEIRCYSLVVLFSLLIIVLFEAYYCIDNPSPKKRLLFIIISVAAVNTQYFLSFLLLSNCIYLLINGRKGVIIKYFADMVFVMITLLWLPFIITTQVAIHSTGGIEVNIIGILKFLFTRLDDYIFFRHYFPIRYIGYLVEVLIVIAIIVFLVKNGDIRKLFKDNNLYIIQLATVLSCFALIYPILGGNLLRIRHTATIFPLVILLFIKVISHLKRQDVKRIIVIALFLFYGTGSYSNYKSFSKDLNIMESLNYVYKEINEDEPIVLIRYRIAVPFTHYFEGTNEIYLLPYPFDFSKPWDFESLVKPAESQYLEEIISKIKESNGFWILNLYFQDWQERDILTIINLTNDQYTMVSDTIISDPKKNEPLFSIQIRKFEQN